jgi:hypothetical protein
VATVSGNTAHRALGLVAARVGVLVFVVGALGSCQGHSSSPVYVVVGSEASDRVEFRPVSSYAELLVQPGQRRELRITLASYQASCDSFVEPGEHDTSAIVTVIAPDSVELAPGTYPWAGHEAHGGTEEQPERAYALPTVRIGHRGLVLPAGGEIQLEAVTTTQDGRVRGLLAFEFAGDADHAAASLKGSFEARLCRARM